LKWRTDRQWH